MKQKCYVCNEKLDNHNTCMKRACMAQLGYKKIRYTTFFFNYFNSESVK